MYNVFSYYSAVFEAVDYRLLVKLIVFVLQYAWLVLGSMRILTETSADRYDTRFRKFTKKDVMISVT